MEWVLDEDHPEAVSALRRELMAYVRRHGEAGSDFAGCEHRRVVLVTGSEPIDRVMDMTGVRKGLFETTADPATLDE